MTDSLTTRIDKALAITRAATPVVRTAYFCDPHGAWWHIESDPRDGNAIVLWRVITEKALAAVQHAIVFRDAMEAQDMGLRLPSSMIEGNPGSYREILRQLDDSFRAVNQALAEALP